MRRTSETRRPRFWLPAVAGALFILAGAYWISTPMFRVHAPADGAGGTAGLVDAGAPR
jgi:hypothetical protein